MQNNFVKFIKCVLGCHGCLKVPISNKPGLLGSDDIHTYVLYILLIHAFTTRM